MKKILPIFLISYIIIIILHFIFNFFPNEIFYVLVLFLVYILLKLIGISVLDILKKALNNLKKVLIKMKEMYGNKIIYIFGSVLLVIILINLSSDEGSSDEGSSDNTEFLGKGDSSCIYEVKSRIKSIGGIHTGIDYKGNGMFMAFVSSSTTNYEYKVVYFYTNSDCEIIKLKIQ